MTPPYQDSVELFLTKFVVITSHPKALEDLEKIFELVAADALHKFTSPS